jgi:hypothetical protein
MCEYCGCQNVPGIALLTEEHDAIRAVARDVIKAAHAGDRAGAIACTRQLLALLGPHTAVEEQGLFPAMAHEFPDHVASLETDHRFIEGTLYGVLDEPTPDPRWDERLIAACARLFDHILREQDGLFPATLAVLTPQQWDELAATRAAITEQAATHSA